MKTIALTQGKVALVSDEDYDELSIHSWHTVTPHNVSYAVRSERQPGGKVPTYLMHRVIVDAPKGIEVDHINGDGLDNQRSNLRLATHSQNLCNRRLDANNTSGYKGVHWDKQGKKWVAQINNAGRQITLGLFDDIGEAAAAYDEASLKYHGEFGVTNASLGAVA
jgi:hypothetical protein